MLAVHLEDLRVITLPWPTQGADLNVIEDVWALLMSHCEKLALVMHVVMYYRDA